MEQLFKNFEMVQNHWAKLRSIFENDKSNFSGSQWNDAHKVVKDIVVYQKR